MGIPLNYSVRALWVRRATTIGTALGIGLVVFVLASSRMLADGLTRTLVSSGSPGKAMITAEDAFDESSSRLTHETVSLMQAPTVIQKAADGVPRVAAESVVHVYLGKPGEPERVASVQLRGVPANVLEVRPEVSIIEGRPIRAGTSEAVVGRGLLGRYEGLVLGGSIALQKGRSATIVGVLASGGSAYESEVWIDGDTLRTAFGSLGYYSSVTAVLEHPQDFERLKLELESDPRRGLKVERESAYYQRISSRLGALISGLGGLVSAIFSIGAMLGAMLTMFGSVDQRRKEIGTLRAIGFTSGQVSLAFIVEAAALAVCGGVVGMALALLTPLIDFSTINYVTGQEVAFRFVPSLASSLGSFAAGAAVGVVGGLLPALKAASGDPVEALRAQ